MGIMKIASGMILSRIKNVGTVPSLWEESMHRNRQPCKSRNVRWTGILYRSKKIIERVESHGLWDKWNNRSKLLDQVQINDKKGSLPKETLIGPHRSFFRIPTKKLWGRSDAPKLFNNGPVRFLVCRDVKLWPFDGNVAVRHCSGPGYFWRENLSRSISPVLVPASNRPATGAIKPGI